MHYVTFSNSNANKNKITIKKKTIRLYWRPWWSRSYVFLGERDPYWNPSYSSSIYASRSCFGKIAFQKELCQSILIFKSWHRLSWLKSQHHTMFYLAFVCRKNGYFWGFVSLKITFQKETCQSILIFKSWHRLSWLKSQHHTMFYLAFVCRKNGYFWGFVSLKITFQKRNVSIHFDF